MILIEFSISLLRLYRMELLFLVCLWFSLLYMFILLFEFINNVRGGGFNPFVDAKRKILLDFSNYYYLTAFLLIFYSFIYMVDISS